MEHNTVTVEVSHQSISGTTKQTNYDLEIVSNGVRYYPIKKLSKLIQKSQRQVERYLTKINEKEMYRYIITVAGVRYISPGVFILSKEYRNKVQNIEYAKWLSTFTWTHALCITVENMGLKKARYLMQEYWLRLQKVYPERRMIMFFTTEKHTDSSDYHIHAILSLETRNRSEKPLLLAKRLFTSNPSTNIWEQKFEQTKGYVSYIVKYLHREQDGHDFFKQHV